MVKSIGSAAPARGPRRYLDISISHTEGDILEIYIHLSCVHTRRYGVSSQAKKSCMWLKNDSTISHQAEHSSEEAREECRVRLGIGQQGGRPLEQSLKLVTQLARRRGDEVPLLC